MAEVLEWNNGMSANTSKFQIMFLGLKRKNKLCLNINGQLITPSEHVKLLGVTIDNALKFDTHVHRICEKANLLIKTILDHTRLRPYLESDKPKVLLNAVVLSNCSYCPLIWLFCSKTATNDINRPHKRALRILYRDCESTFEELLERDNTKTTHTKNQQKLMIEVYKSFNHLNPEYM